MVEAAASRGPVSTLILHLPSSPPPGSGLLLHDVTMAGLQELRFPEEKPLLRGQDVTELDNPDTFLSVVDTDWKLIFPDLVEGLVLMNIDPNGKGWIDWAATKLSGLTSTLPDTVLSHLFSQEELVNNTELVQNYRQQISNVVNQANLQLFWNMYNSRRDLDINRPGTVPNAKTLRCPVMLVVGDNAPAEDGVVSVTPLRRRLRTCQNRWTGALLQLAPCPQVECNSKLDPTTTTFLKMADSGGLPQVTQPGKLTEAFKYFLQGMGYIAHLKDRRLSGGAVPSASMTRLARSRTASLTSASSVDGSRPQPCAHSESSEAMGQVNHTMEVSC
ncbi:Protein NDRG4 [Microtus ochrogaster]|uniref:Protein NDRG4 n=1 Tax=Microtus ochrogaster TaxID=79684 RepID=A0A8J6FZN9_MICOH|nr:Protein NDRG4 [Microtus ochrogaster]